MENKTCKICGETKPLTDYKVAFISKASNLPIIMSYCRSCSSKKATQYFVDNPDKRYARDKKYYENHKELKAEKHATYRTSIPPAVYGIFSNNMLLYIGESSVPYGRRIEHFTKSHTSPISKGLREGLLKKSELKQVILHYEDDDAKRYAVEQAYINALQPPLNTYGK
jgi:hypothetical protein